MAVRKNSSGIGRARSYATRKEKSAYERLNELHEQTELPQQDVLANLGLFHTRASFARMQFMHNLYRKALYTHGVVMEFGVRWGQNLALFTTFRNIFEPYNTSRKVIGFDTFSGFPSVDTKDGSSETARVGALSVTENYDEYLEKILSAQELLGPRDHIRKHELVKGDVVDTLPKYLNEHPETIIALAYFDLTLYEPTKRCLELIKPHLVTNSVIGFDELLLEEYPGETLALKEAWGLTDIQLNRDPMSPYQSYFIFGEKM